MSFYSDASLVMIPSGYKTSKVYCAKPTDGSGDLVFSRSNDTATRVNSAGLIEKVRTNLLKYSQAFDNADWIKSINGTGITPVVTANNATAPDGTMTADTIVFNAGAGTSSSDLSTIYQSLTLSGTLFAGSFYARVTSGTGQLVFRHALGGAYTKANLTTTWQRFSSAESFGGGTQYFELGIRRDVAEPVNASVTVQLWGAQLEVGDVPTDYIATTSAAVSVGPVANVPRLDYLGSSCPRLLLEPQRSNIITYSEQFDNAAWTKTSVAVTANATASPDGYANADLFTTNDLSGTVYRAYHNSTGGTDAINTISGFFKYGNHPYAYITADSSGIGKYAIFNVQTGVITFTSTGYTSTITDYGDGWYRCTLTGTIDSNNNVQFGLAPNANVYAGSSLANGKTLYVWGAQREYNVSYTTSYIPTLGASVTRGTDAAYKASISTLIGQTEGVAFIDFVWNGLTGVGSYPRIIELWGDSNNYIQLFNVSGSATIYWDLYVGGFTQASGNAAMALGRNKIAVAYKTNDFAVYKNGTLIASDTSCTVPATSALGVAGSYDGAGAQLAASVNQTLLFKTRLSNSELASLTTI